MRDRTHHRSQPSLDFTARTSHLPDAPGKYISTLLRLTAILLAATLAAHAQWDIEESHTTASLRGIHNVGGGVAWASGTHGTVLRTEDGGYLWQTCAIPPGAENLDFRGIQAFDENTAIVMSSAPGDQSRLYKTTDGCQTWHLLFTNPDKQGFWDAFVFNFGGNDGLILGDPVDGSFALFGTIDGKNWKRESNTGLEAKPSEGAFAASNSSIAFDEINWVVFGTGGSTTPSIYQQTTYGHYLRREVPLTGGSHSAGVFAINGRSACCLVAVGGDYQKPNSPRETAALSHDGGKNWNASTTPPHGYRSSVAYDPTQKLWITVGPNGTDISRDDGKNWQPLKPSGYDPADADKNWNALSLPFVVGPNGRIGKLRTITPAPSAAKP
jgi:photosystem II stability/assembly factor-like uncharacterized protein